MTDQRPDPKSFPFERFIVNPGFFIPTLDDFKLLRGGDAFFFDESEEALTLMSDADREAIDAMEKAFS